jgi:predicted nucleic acid-binding protein
MAGRSLILDASTAILLAKVDLLRLVAGLGDVWMAETAFQEATLKNVEDARMIRQLESEGLIRRSPAKGEVAKVRKDFRLDAGESDTIALAQEMGGVCGTDDGPALRCCRVLGVPFTSAIALLAALAESGRLSRDLGLELLTQLERFGRYDPRILEDVARRVRSASAGPGGEKS